MAQGKSGSKGGSQAKKGSGAKGGSKGKPKKKPVAPPPSRKFPVFWIVIAVVLALGIVAIFLTRKNSQPPKFNTDTTVTATGTSLPKFPEGNQPDPATGMTSPELTGTSLSGAPMSITNDGKPRVIILLAHWCPHCQKEVPLVQKWLNAGGKPADVDLVAIATGNDPARPNYPPTVWLDREHWTVPTMVDSPPQTAANVYGLTGFPFWVVVDAQGRVVGRLSGEVTEENLTTVFNQAKSGAPTGPVTAPDSASKV